jgi:aminoglycoside phosphotransferase (APT) family kinase protein
VEGVVPSDNPPYVFDGWLLAADPADRRKLEDRTLAALAALHTVTPDRADLGFLEPQAPGASYLERLLGVQRRYYDWACEGQAVPLVEEAFEVLAARVPSIDRVALSWGDSRIGNVLYRDFEPVSVLDWEMATLAPPDVDLGWMTLMHANFQSIAEAYGFAGLPDLLQRDQAVAIYERHAGYRLGNLAWHEAFAALRMAVISIRTSLRGIAFGLQEPPADPDDLITFQATFRKVLEEIR